MKQSPGKININLLYMISILNFMIDISSTCLTSFPQIHFILILSPFLMRTHLCQVRSEIIINFGHISKKPLELWMAAILPAPLLHTSGMRVETERVSSHKIVYLHVILPSILSMHSLDGRDQPRMLEFGMTHGKMGVLSFRMGITI